MTLALPALALALAAAGLEVSGDVEVVVTADARAAEVTKGDAAIVPGPTTRISAGAGADARVAMGGDIDQVTARDGARVKLVGFTGKALTIVATSNAHVVVDGVAGKSVERLRVSGAGTSRIDADGLRVEAVDVALRDAARARVTATKSLTCDLQRASRLVVSGKPARVEKKIAGVAKLQMR